MGEIDYRGKYDNMSIWVGQVIRQTNELYQTLTEQIVLLTGENNQLRNDLDSTRCKISSLEDDIFNMENKAKIGKNEGE